MAEMQKLQQASKFGDVREISAQDYVDEVNKAGKGIWVVLHLYKSGYPFVLLIVMKFNMCFCAISCLGVTNEVILTIAIVLQWLEIPLIVILL